MLVRCPRCGGVAELGGRIDFVHCGGCCLKISYLDYLKEMISKEQTYGNILEDYK